MNYPGKTKSFLDQVFLLRVIMGEKSILKQWMDGKVQCLETVGQNVFVCHTVHCCSIPVLSHFLSYV